MTKLMTVGQLGMMRMAGKMKRLMIASTGIETPDLTSSSCSWMIGVRTRTLLSVYLSKTT